MHHIWGFTVHASAEHEYHAYGTLHLGEHRTFVAHFVPAKGERWTRQRPISKWRMTRIILGNVWSKDWGYYESKIVTERDGTRHLVYCRNNGPGPNLIMAQQMRDLGHIERQFEPQVLLRPDGFRSEDRNPRQRSSRRWRPPRPIVTGG